MRLGSIHPKRLVQYRNGFSMLEAMIAITLTTMAGTAIVTGLSASVQSSTYLNHLAMARGLAEQLAQEISAAEFPTASDVVSTSTTRDGFNDLDDYHNWSSSPPVDRTGRTLGTQSVTAGAQRVAAMRVDTALLSRFRREVVVERVTPNQTSGWDTTIQNSNYRRVTIRVGFQDNEGTEQQLIEQTQIYSYVPLTP